MSWQLAAPLAVAGLVAAANTVTGPDVHLSLVVTASGNTEAIVIAGSSDPQSDQHYIEHKPDTPGYSSDVEDTFTVWNEIAVLSGDSDMSAAMNRCYEILAGFGQAIADDPYLGTDGTVMQAWVGEVGYRARQTPRGAVASLLVAVDCQAYTGT